MNDAERTALIAAAKKTAIPIASCVSGGVRLDHLLPGKSHEEKDALIVVLAAAVDHARLHVLAALPGDEGLSAEMLREVEHKRAEAAMERLRRAGWTPPEGEQPLRHEHETDLYPVIAVLAEALTGVPQMAARRNQQDQQQGEAAA